MNKVLFVPLNTNHVLIFERIMSLLNCPYDLLCHDRISEAEQYHTEHMLNNRGIDFIHFSTSIQRSTTDNLPLRVTNFFKMKRQIRDVLRRISPKLVVLAIDHDPISQIFIKESRVRGIQTLLIQEGLLRPHEYSVAKIRFSDYFYILLRLLGIYLKYSKYGLGGCDRILLGGKIAADIMTKRGVPQDRIRIVGHPKYDSLLEKIRQLQPINNERKTYLFAASTSIVRDESNIRLLRKLVEAANGLGLLLIVKLHPRTSHSPSDIYNVVNTHDKSSVEIVKQGDETFEILKRSDAFITVSSTMILDALIMNKECIVANYLAGESRLEYDSYDAVHSIESEDDISGVIKTSISFRKSYQNKKRLLEDELFKLDGKAGWRAARFIENMVS